MVPPVLLALSAYSPFYDGNDTGLVSARAQVFSELPNTGVPMAFETYAEYARFEERMVRTRSIADAGQLWWDVRPQAEFGTIEIRAPDAQSALQRRRYREGGLSAASDAIRLPHRSSPAGTTVATPTST